jgi:hypothetical protein
LLLGRDRHHHQDPPPPPTLRRAFTALTRLLRVPLDNETIDDGTYGSASDARVFERFD